MKEPRHAWENRLAKYYFLPCFLRGEIDWSKVDPSTDFSCIPTNSKGHIKGLEVGDLRDIVSDAYSLGFKHGMERKQHSQDDTSVAERMAER